MTTRREFLGTAATGLTVAAGGVAANPPKGDGPFRHRGYYTIMTRYPTAGLAVWKHILDCMAADGCNLLVHWIGGGFRSRKYPHTWQHNADHENVKADFTQAMIDHAHSKGIKVLLGFTPFAYDGVNRHTAEHPTLAATGKDGRLVDEGGIFCFGRNLCPALPKSQEFMLGYARELAFDFYPGADGMFIESSDYSTCHCPRCGPKYFDHEFAFVQAISDEVWAKNPKATVVVYPHYFSGDNAPIAGEGAVKGAKHPFDPRWTLFFTPHSTKLNAGLVKRAKDSLWWNEAMVFGTPADVRDGARHARANGFTGYTPTLEAYSYVPTRVEHDGEKWLVGRRQVPFGIGWVSPDKSPYDELPIRVSRIAFREFTRDPDLPLEEFKSRIGKEVFGADATPQQVADLLALQAAFSLERSWCLASPLAEPLRVKEMKERGKLTPEKAAVYRGKVEELRAVAGRNDGDLAKAAQWVVDRWAGENAALIGLKGDK